jgi:N-methylhydantoinase B
MDKIRIEPVLFEILRHKLWQITEQMSIAIRRVSGSTITCEAKDLSANLYDGQGTMLMCGCGVTAHASTMPFAIKHVIETCSEDPGIHDGDVFYINDPYISALHIPDGAVMTPIFYKGELVGWAQTMTHIVDVGGIDPGGFCPRATEIFHEGFRFPGIKIAEGGIIRRDVFNSMLNMVRDPGMVGLDLRAQLAAGTVARARIIELIECYGLDVYKAMCDEIVKYAEMRMRARLAELPDGTWQVVDYLDDDGMTDKAYRIVLTLTKKGDSLTFDFTGTDEQAPSYMNSGAVGVIGAVFAGVAPMLGYDIPWSQGILNPIKVVLPEGTVVRARYPAPCSMGTIGICAISLTMTVVALSKMLSSSEKYKEDAIAAWGTSTGTWALAGLNQYKTFGVCIFMDQQALGGGAKSYADGVDVGGHFLIPAGSAPNVELYESRFPILYLFRRQAIDTGGPGKFRGGVGGEYCVALHDTPLGALRSIRFGYGSEVPIISGICGGYPGCNTCWMVVKDSDILERLERGDLPKEIKELKGELMRVRPNGVMPVTSKDVLYYRWHAGGGYGDPIDREPQLTRRDVVNGLVSIECAMDVYGVIIDPETLEVDAKKTEQKRGEIRKGRLEAKKIQ